MSKNYSDRELVDGCIRNDRLFQELLYRKFFAKMIAMCLRYTKDREQALEIVNDGFLRVFKKLDTFKFKGSLEGWIRRIVYHSVSDYFRKNSKYLARIVLEEKDSKLEAEVHADLYADDIMKLVGQLPPATQKVFKLYAIEGYTHPEIAKKLSISDGTSKWHLSEARKKLRHLLEQHNYVR